MPIQKLFGQFPSKLDGYVRFLYVGKVLDSPVQTKSRSPMGNTQQMNVLYSHADPIRQAAAPYGEKEQSRT